MSEDITGMEDLAAAYSEDAELPTTLREHIPEKYRNLYDQEIELTNLNTTRQVYMKKWVIQILTSAEPSRLTDREKELQIAIQEGKVQPIPDEPGFDEIASVTASVLDYNLDVQREKRKEDQPGLIRRTIETIIEHFPRGVQEHIEDMVDVMRGNKWIPDDYADELIERGEENPVVWGVPVALIMIWTALQHFQTRFESFNLMTEREANREFQGNIPDWHDLINIAFYDDDVKEQVTDILLDLGIAEKYHDNLLKTAKTVLSTQEIMSLYWRGNIDDVRRDELLEKAGIVGEEHDLLLHLFERIPGIQDLIQMSVREAFNDDVAREFGYDEDYPPEFGEFAEKQGYSEDWARRYWRAHWELPSPGQGYEMLHRGLLTEDNLQLLLRARDIPRFWRERLIQMSHRLLTRVDIRRMHDLGVLDDQDVYEQYRKQGYTDLDAKRMTLFTVKFNMERERDLSRSQIETAYEDGTISRSDAEDFLQNIGYDQDETEIMLDRVDIDQEQDRIEQRIDIIEEKYVNGKISSNTVQEQLYELDVEPEQVTLYIDQWTLDREKKIERPSLATLRRWRKKEIISEQEFRDEMRLIGWDDYYIDLYLQEI